MQQVVSRMIAAFWGATTYLFMTSFLYTLSAQAKRVYSKKIFLKEEEHTQSTTITITLRQERSPVQEMFPLAIRDLLTYEDAL